jgi:phospholipid/cholesterol/gamma-HCH transport system substrate-binding protein
VTNLNKTIVNVKDGKGALNYLSNDPKLVRQIDSTMTNVNESSAKLNENLEALKHNFLSRIFRRLERDKRKRKKK